MDYLPRKRDAREVWLQNISDKILVEGPKFGLTAGEATAAKALADGALAKMKATDAAAAATDSARALETSDPSVKQLRGSVKNWKTRPGWVASGSEGVLRLKGVEDTFDPNTYKPVITAKVAVNVIEIDFDKKGADGLNIYCRLRGTATWRKLAFDTHPPYVDTFPLANPAVPEVREYKGIGAVDDAEIGLESDIVSVTFAG